MSDKTVLITGSSKGLGRSLALVFADNQWNVILHGRDGQRLDEVRSEIIKRGVYCAVVIGDITLEETRNALYQASEVNGIDVLINNAAIYASKPFRDIASKEFRGIIEVNLIAPVQLIQRVFPIFIKQKSGVIININSIGGKNPGELESAYCASKHGLGGFTQAIQTEANKHNVRILNVYIGAMKTTMTMGRRDSDKFINTSDVAEAIHSLCKDYPSMVISEIEIRRKNY
jgi:short-subunit dehydrogenase